MQMEPYGFTVIPPDSFGNQQRVFVPRASLRSVEVLGVVGSPLKSRRPSPPPRNRSACSMSKFRALATPALKNGYGILEFNT